MKPRDKSALGLVVLVLIALIGYFAFVAPKHHQAATLENQISAAHASLSTVESQVANGAAEVAEYRRLSGQLTAVAKAVPSDDQVPALIDELQNASSRSKVSFDAVSAGASGSTTTASVTPTVAGPATGSAANVASLPSDSFSLSFTGNYFAVANLLGRLADFVHADNQHFRATGRLLTISTLDLGPPSQAGTSAGTATATGDGRVTAAVTASDYLIPSSLDSQTASPTTPTTSVSTS